MTEWEYCCEYINPEAQPAEIESTLLRLGAQGWEAVCTIPDKPLLIFKRPKSFEY